MKIHQVDSKAWIKKIKISIITHEIYPVLSGGAIYVERIANELGQLGFEVSVLSQQIGNNSTYAEDKKNFQIIRFWTGRKSQGNASFFDHLRFFLFGMPQILYYIKSNKIAMNLCLFTIPAGLFGCISKLVTGVPFISIVDGADMPNIKSDMSKFVLVLKPIFIAVNKYSDAVALLEGLDDIALPLLKNKNIYKIGSGIDVPKDKANPSSKKDGILRILSIGRLTSRKGFDLIVEACRIVKQSNRNFHLDIIGYGNEEVNIARKILDYGLQENITLVGRIEYDELSSYYKNSDCYIFYGDREGQSLAMMDAVAYGLPVICSDHPGNTTFVKSGINGFAIDHPDVEKLALAILSFIRSYDSLHEMGEQSRMIAQDHSWKNIAIRYKEIINKVLRC